jgi:hypothetical protein
MSHFAQRRAPPNFQGRVTTPDSAPSPPSPRRARWAFDGPTCALASHSIRETLFTLFLEHFFWALARETNTRRFSIYRLQHAQSRHLFSKLLSVRVRRVTVANWVVFGNSVGCREYEAALKRAAQHCRLCGKFLLHNGRWGHAGFFLAREDAIRRRKQSPLRPFSSQMIPPPASHYPYQHNALTLDAYRNALPREKALCRALFFESQQRAAHIIARLTSPLDECNPRSKGAKFEPF